MTNERGKIRSVLCGETVAKRSSQYNELLLALVAPVANGNVLELFQVRELALPLGDLGVQGVSLSSILRDGAGP